jgi:hypothetical protein
MNQEGGLTSVITKRTKNKRQIFVFVNPVCMIIEKDMLIYGREETETIVSKVNKLLKKRRAHSLARRLVKKL